MLEGGGGRGMKGVLEGWGWRVKHWVDLHNIMRRYREETGRSGVDVREKWCSVGNWLLGVNL